MDNFTATYNFTKDEWNSCLKVLSTLKEDPFHNPDNTHFASLITKIHKQAKKTNRKQSYTEKKYNDLEIINGSVISQKALQNETSFDHTKEKKHTEYATLEIPKHCYCCNQSFVLAHSFYNRLCPDCAIINYENRFKEIDLSNRHVILTGGCVKIGYATALKLLRSNAKLMVTTRFPGLALEQYKKEKDYEEWKDQLTLYGLDLRNLNAVQEFITYYRSTYDSLDILINNAAQTIKYTDAYYQPLIQQERELIAFNKPEITLIQNKTPIVESHTILESVSDRFGLQLNRFGQPIDTRTKNSWNSTLEEIDMIELLEVNLINQISPYHLIKELTPLLKASTFNKKFIINVTSSEGQFSYTNKSIFHPHTNMTKASLNMLTRTSARAYEKNKIYMNAVDVGWVSTGAQETLRKKQFDAGYIPPLDPVDGASRIMLPIIEGIKNIHNPVGKLLKNYKVETW
ncbi:SDR family oxidoreductase [Aquimarina sp. 2201CG14-23]|uniref:SDR family oxidoreductase n=1 Tax=Aquimarina mycalae TaxID=3040073 RepID=UPI002477E188|nr:SDR family oxidoreductase [Aquimarina sp. 2201CG14-23]MDH7447743.1 SDR family oxidoreductase [Aquimarina sp. 2201CG14-23]